MNRCSGPVVVGAVARVFRRGKKLLGAGQKLREVCTSVRHPTTEANGAPTRFLDSARFARLGVRSHLLIEERR